MEALFGLGHTVVTFLVVLTVLVFVHEWGHYWVARRCGVRVETFSIGFGKELFGWTDKVGTRWKVSALPLGGYVKFFGDANGASMPGDVSHLSPEERKVAFHSQTVGKRMAIVAAGPVANFIFAIIILAGFFVVIGQAYTPANVGQVLEGSAAEAAGFEPGDRVISIDGKEIKRFQDMQQIVSLHPGEPLRVVVERAGSPVTLTAVPERVEVPDPMGQPMAVGRLGITVAAQDFVKRNPVEAVYYATVETGNIIRLTVAYIGQIFEGKRSGEELGGPLRIAKYSSVTAKEGAASLIWFMAMLSINLGFINLLPVPMLDGGHLAFYTWEAVTGRPLSARIQEYGFRIGLALVLSLMVFVTWNDIAYLKLFSF